MNDTNMRGIKRKAPSQVESKAKKAAFSILSNFSGNGNLLTFGQGDFGQLGLGPDVTEKEKAACVHIEGQKFVQVLAGGMHTAALTTEGKVFTWGCNDDGALGRLTEGNDEAEYLPGKVELVDDLFVSFLSAGDSHTAVLTKNGHVYAWGAFRDSSGQIGLTSPEMKNKGLTAKSFGKNEVCKIFPLDDNSDELAIKIASGNDHLAILTNEGAIYTAGTGEQGQLGRVKEAFGFRGGRRGLDMILHPQKVRMSRKQRWQDIFCGSFCSFAVNSEKDVYAWGLNNYGQLGTGDNENQYTPVKVDGISTICKESGVVTISSGQHHSLVCANSGKVYSMGRADYGRLGLGEDAKECSEPTLIETGDRKHSNAACGAGVSFAITEQGELYAWGQGTNMQLGTGSEDEDILVPTLVKSKNINPELHKVLSVSSGGQHTAVLVTEKSV